MKHQTIFAFAAVLFGVAYLIDAIQPAQAFPNSPGIYASGNPVQSFAGTVPNSNPTSIFTASSDADFLIKDMFLTKSGSSTGDCSGVVYLTTSSGSKIGEFIVSSSVDGNSGWGAANITHQFASGLSVPAGEDLIIDGSYCGAIVYTIAGFHVHP